MGILTRPLMRPQQRWDLEDYNTALSALRADSHFYTSRFLASSSYIMQGFTISQGFIGQATAEVSLTNATLINANNTGDFSWWTAPTSPTPLTLPTGVGGLQAGRNYVELQLYAQDGTPLQRAFWDPSANSGQGLEFVQEVNTVTELFVKVVVNQSGFTSGNPNLIRMAIVDLDGSLNIKGIRDKRDLFYRLGTPDNIDAAFTWGSRVESATTLTFTVPAASNFLAGETVTFTSGATAVVQSGGTNNIHVFDFSTDSLNPGDVVAGGTSGATATLSSYYEAFTGADKDINNMSAMVRALMNEIRVVKGTRFWYEVGNAASLPGLLNFVNALLAPLTVGARFAWSGTALKITDNATSGQATSDEIAAIRIPGFNNDLILTREDGTGGSATISIPDKSILFVQLPASGDRTYSESGPGPTNYQVVDIGSFVPSDHNYIIGYREGTHLILGSGGNLDAGEEEDIGQGISKEILAFIGAPTEESTNPPYTYIPSADLSNQFTTADSLTQAISINAANVNDIAAALLKPYQEALTVVVSGASGSHQVNGPLGIGAVVTIPLDSRNTNIQKTYRVGQGGLMLFLNGQELNLGDDYLEVGTSGTLSQTIQMLQTLVVGDVLDIRVLIPQLFGTAASDQPFFLNYIVGQNGSQVPTGALYNQTTERLQIWRNGLSMLRTSSVGDLTERYQETANNSVTISDVANPSEVFVMVNHAAPSPSVTLLTGLTGTVLTVPTYVIGNGALRVFRNGILLSTNVGADSSLQMTETSTTSVTLALAAGSTDVFKIFISGSVPTWRKSITGVSGTTVTIPGGVTYSPGTQRLLVLRNGLLMNNSTVIGQPVDRYQQSGNNAVTLQLAAVSSDLFEFIYI